jgi:hypothetical protein
MQALSDVPSNRGRVVDDVVEYNQALVLREEVLKLVSAA